MLTQRSARQPRLVAPKSKCTQSKATLLWLPSPRPALHCSPATVAGSGLNRAGPAVRGALSCSCQGWLPTAATACCGAASCAVAAAGASMLQSRAMHHTSTPLKHSTREGGWRRAGERVCGVGVSARRTGPEKGVQGRHGAGAAVASPSVQPGSLSSAACARPGALGRAARSAAGWAGRCALQPHGRGHAGWAGQAGGRAGQGRRGRGRGRASAAPLLLPPRLAWAHRGLPGWRELEAAPVQRQRQRARGPRAHPRRRASASGS